MKTEKLILDSIFVASWKGDRKYLSLPNISAPRLVASLQNWRIFSAGLKIQNTASIKNRIIKSIILLLYPVIKLLSSQRVSITSEFKTTIQTALELLEFKSVPEFSFYVGTSGSKNRKITIQLLDDHGTSLGFIKYPLSSESEVYIDYEYGSLRRLGQYYFSNLIIPKKFQTFSLEDGTVLFQENIFLGASRLSNSLNHLIVDASFELGNFTKTTDVEHYLDALLKSAYELPLDETLINRISETVQIIINKRIPIVTIHGDFVLYNMQKKDSKLALIDWEYSRSGLPLFDLYHFVFQGKYQIEKMNVFNCLKEVFSKKNVDYYKSYLKKLSIDEDIFSFLFVLYLIDTLFFDMKVKSETQVKESHFYKALELYKI